MNKIVRNELNDLGRRIATLNRRVTELHEQLVRSPSPTRSSPSPKRPSPVRSMGQGRTLGGKASTRSPRSAARNAAESRRVQYTKSKEYRNKLNAAARAQIREQQRKKNLIMRRWKMMIKYPHYKARILKLN